MTRVDSLLPLMHHDLSDLASLILVQIIIITVIIIKETYLRNVQCQIYVVFTYVAIVDKPRGKFP